MEFHLNRMTLVKTSLESVPNRSNFHPNHMNRLNLLWTGPFWTEQYRSGENRLWPNDFVPESIWPLIKLDADGHNQFFDLTGLIFIGQTCLFDYRQ